MENKELLTDLFNLLDPLNVIYNEFPPDEYSSEVNILYNIIEKNPNITPEQIGNEIYRPEDYVTLEKCILLGSIYFDMINGIKENEYRCLIENIFKMWDPFFKEDEIPKNIDYSPYVEEIISNYKIKYYTLDFMKMLLFNDNPRIDTRDNSVKIFIKLINRLLK